MAVAHKIPLQLFQNIVTDVIQKDKVSIVLLIVIYLHRVMLYIVSSQLLRPESHNTVMGSHA